MKNQSVFKDFAKYVSLSVLGQIALSCYTLADTFFVSAKLGANGLTALNLAFPIFCIINGVGLMIGMGGGTKYSIYRSREQNDVANRIFTNALYIAACFAVVFVLAGAFLSGQIVRFLGADDTTFAMTKTYAQVMLLFAPAFLLNNLLQCFVRNDGKPSLSMAAMITGSLSNVLLDYIFIFPLDMGIFGAILATGLAPVISICVISPYLIMRKNRFHFSKSKPSAKYHREILSSGFSPFLTEATSGVVMFLFNFIILRTTGNVGVAAFGVISVISLVVIAMYTGLSQGAQPVMSTNHGAQNVQNVKTVLKYSLVSMLVLSVAIYATIFFGASGLTKIFNSEQNQTLQSLAEVGLKLYFIACSFIGFNIVLATYFISTEKPLYAQIISLSRGFFVLIPIAFLLSHLFGMIGVWCAYPVSECIVAVIGAILYIHNERRKKYDLTTPYYRQPRTEPPTEKHSSAETNQPTVESTNQPTAKPTDKSTVELTDHQTAGPTNQPITKPNNKSTANPTNQPTAESNVAKTQSYKNRIVKKRRKLNSVLTTIFQKTRRKFFACFLRFFACFSHFLMWDF